MLKNLFLYKEPGKKYNFEIMPDKNPDTDIIPSMENVSRDIRVNLEYVRQVFSCDKNGDIVIREFDVSIDGSLLSGFVVGADGLVGSSNIAKSILTPLMCLSDL